MEQGAWFILGALFGFAAKWLIRKYKQRRAGRVYAGTGVGDWPAQKQHDNGELQKKP